MNGNSAAFSAVEMFDLVATPTNSARRLSFSSFPFPVREPWSNEEDEWS